MDKLCVIIHIIYSKENFVQTFLDYWCLKNLLASNLKFPKCIVK
jgi:hypothetical protein